MPNIYRTFTVPGRNNHSAMLTPGGGLLSEFLSYYHAWGISHRCLSSIQQLCVPFRLRSFVLLLTFFFFFLSCGCEVLVLFVSLHLFIWGVAKSCPVPKAVCHRGKSFWFSPFCSFCERTFSCRRNTEGSSNTEVLHLVPQLRRWSVFQADPNRDHTQDVYFSDTTFCQFILK